VDAVYNPSDLLLDRHLRPPYPMANPESSDSPQIKLFLQSRGNFEKRDLASIANSLHKDFRYVSYPRSLGHPEQTKEEWLERYAGIMSLWAAAPEVGYIGCSSDPLRRD
jgi:hypothetical protein